MTIDKVAYWIDIADYDMETAETLYDGGRWLYVAFMCHQAIEKTLKAYWCGTQNTALARILTKETCRHIIDETKQLQQWIKNRL